MDWMRGQRAHVEEEAAVRGKPDRTHCTKARTYGALAQFAGRLSLKMRNGTAYAYEAGRRMFSTISIPRQLSFAVKNFI